MLSTFDWMRRCRTGSELLATINYFAENPDISSLELSLGAPLSAIGRLCHRCYVYAPPPHKNKYRQHCKICSAILTQKGKATTKSLNAIVIWGYVNQVPPHLRKKKIAKFHFGTYIHDDQRFLMMLQRQYIRQWLQELVIYSGTGIRGLIQIFPSVGIYRNLNMGDYLTWAVHHEATLPMDQLRIRFFTSPGQLINPKDRERLGLLTYTVAEFLSMLEMVEVFRAHILPHEQQQLFELLCINDPKEEQFYWGRFLGQLSQEAKDMLSAWKIRQWHRNQINLFYTLIKYVVLPRSY